MNLTYKNKSEVPTNDVISTHVTTEQNPDYGGEENTRKEKFRFSSTVFERQLQGVCYFSINISPPKNPNCNLLYSVNKISGILSTVQSDPKFSDIPLLLAQKRNFIKNA